MPATYGFLSTYPPTPCGLATFNAALADHLSATSGRCGVVRLLAGTPRETAGTPRETAGTPRETVGTPRETAGTPREAAGTPRETVGTPREAAGTPRETPRTPPETAGTPQVAGGGIKAGRHAPRVVHTWPTDTPGGWTAAANALNRFDVAIVQHEYGIYPGDAGEEVLPLLRAVRVPKIVVLHTVLTTPDPLQRSVLERIVATADAVVTMTDTARRRLVGGYRVDPAKISVIPHGTASHPSAPPPDRRDRPHLLTWGLIGPGKGIEWALRALALLKESDPMPTYTVAGRTHPKVLEQQGDAYRDSLTKLAADLGVADAVTWIDAYLDPETLSRLIRSADVVVLPYDSTQQVTSGVLIEAVGAGVPVVATEFPHAVELLADGPGLLVPHQDPEAIAAAVRHLLATPDVAAGLSGLAGGPTLRWPAVAARYQALATRLLDGRPDRTPAGAASIPA